jgi:hypothetical protein
MFGGEEGSATRNPQRRKRTGFDTTSVKCGLEIPKEAFRTSQRSAVSWRWPLPPSADLSSYEGEKKHVYGIGI